MNTNLQVGILGIGAYLPPTVRKNDWWPASTVEAWEEKLAVKKAARVDGPPPPPGATAVIAALAEYANDPFKGAKERRVMDETMLPSAMEIAAGQEAIARAGIDRAEIGLLLTYSQLPDYLAVPNAPTVHAGLGLGEWCLSITIDSACNAFQTQLTLAQKMIQSGQTKYALLVQSSAAQHLARPQDQMSAWFGDGAAAVVLGPVKEGFGILSAVHRTDGTLNLALIGGCPEGGRWFDGKNPITCFLGSREQAIRMTMSLPELGKQVIEKALDQAGLKKADVNFYAAHQGTHWFRKVTQEHIGLSHARSFDSYAFTTSLSAANIPFVMRMAEQEGQLRPGDLVAMYSGGSGITVSGTILRYGTGA